MLFDTHLTEEFDALRDTVKRMCDSELAPRAAGIDAKNEFPADMWKKLGELGLLGMTVPESYGGTGLGYLAHVVAMEEVSRASASVGLSYGAHSNLCVNNLFLNGSEAQRREYLLKRRRRDWKIELIERHNPTWRDLFPDVLRLHRFEP